MKLFVIIVTLALAFAPARAAEPVRLIFDTDIGNDVDDVLALGMIHTLQTRGTCDLIAVTVTKDHELAGPMVDVVNYFYGRRGIPIGVVRGGATRDEGKFLGMTREKDGDRLRYPHDLKRSIDAPDAVTVLRKVLADQPDGSVVIAQVGFATNLARLLESPADTVSPLTGKELAAKKVKFVSAMFGAYKVGGQNAHREYNVTEDLPAAKKFVADWPTPIVFSGFEVGQTVTYPSVSIEKDFSYAKHHPLAEAYRRYSPPPHDRPCWDLTSVLYAVHSDRGYFGLSETGRVTVGNTGLTEFAPAVGGAHRFLTVSKEQAIRCREAFAFLASQPPAGK
ncbi:nucleoside hydrolase [Zavarzinella formosa]|uniref:nucleoside hydrolase n=1 Tax=Zavarzinella formosa TaxID=360055 RepID=UPI001930D6C2|nr:nucleoside hydrolase [Zavarzinella formosa]